MLLRKKEEIENWLNLYKIKNYELIPNEKYGYIVNGINYIDLNNKDLKNIDVKFNIINGHFDCSNNELESLEGCPEIVHGDFYCIGNRLKTLKYSPKIINGSFYCNSNELESLEGCPENIRDNLNCSYNELISLEGCAKKINGSLYLHGNKLTIEGLKYLPEKIKENYIDIRNNEKLDELQNINKFNNLKEKVEEILKIKKEKDDLLKLINKDELNKNNNINKI